MSVRLQLLLVLGGVAALTAACDPNVVIGAKWRVPGGEGGGQAGVGGVVTGGVGGGGGDGDSGGSEVGPGGAGGADEAGAGGAMAGAGGEPPLEKWCATAPWLNNPVDFANENGNPNEIPAGSYVITYLSGAQLHDVDIGYEVTARYYQGTLEAGHHIYNGDSLETATTKLWLTSDTLTPAATVEAVEAANFGHTWPLTHTGGVLHITLIDNVYSDNKGPGSRFCISAAPP